MCSSDLTNRTPSAPRPRGAPWTTKRPAAIRVAVLADRCVTVLPLHADVVGLRLEVAPTDIVECHVPPYEPDFSVQLLQTPPAGRTV